MRAASRHARPTKPARRLRIPIVAVAALAGAATAFVFLQSGSVTAPRAAASRSGFVNDELVTKVRRDMATVQASMARQTAAAAAARRRALAAARRAHQHAARPTPSSSPSTGPAASPPPQLSSGGNPAQSPLGVCIRDAEEGGSYAWGPGNGGGAYQFLLGTWEHYGGAASEYGKAGAAYQDQIFDNAIHAGGASNWTDYDGC